MRRLANWFSGMPPGGATPPQAPVIESAVSPPAAFPAGLREYLRVTKEANKTIDIAYANDVAWQAARAGQALPDGSVIVMRIHVAERGADGAWAPQAAGRPQLRVHARRLAQGRRRVVTRRTPPPSHGRHRP